MRPAKVGARWRRGRPRPACRRRAGDARLSTAEWRPDVIEPEGVGVRRPRARPRLYRGGPAGPADDATLASGGASRGCAHKHCPGGAHGRSPEPAASRTGAAFRFVASEGRRPASGRYADCSGQSGPSSRGAGARIDSDSDTCTAIRNGQSNRAACAPGGADRPCSHTGGRGAVERACSAIAALRLQRNRIRPLPHLRPRPSGFLFQGPLRLPGRIAAGCASPQKPAAAQITGASRRGKGPICASAASRQGGGATGASPTTFGLALIPTSRGLQYSLA